ncbi:MAG: hypothetical protein HY815_20865 [Candidatus Riflebacteria bacterium]|nr:hypothetical protein [Candidatus Riflebacteria bacterium]
MTKQNCWEFQNCGREPGGKNVDERGACPAAAAARADGINGGQMGGRACWAIAGTFSGGQPCGVVASTLSTCMDCEFYRLVLREERPHTKHANQITAVLGEAIGCRNQAADSRGPRS